MNGKYLFGKKGFLYTPYGNKKDDKFIVDNKGILNIKSHGKSLDNFKDLIYKDISEEKTIDIMKGLTQLGEIEEEKGELFTIRTKKGDLLYFYNTTEFIPEYNENFLLYVDIFYLNKRSILSDKIQSYMNYTLLHNIGTIKNLANTTTIKNVEEFLLNIGNDSFLEKLDKKDEMLLKKIYFLGKGGFLGYKGKTYIYTFRETQGRLQPIVINKDFTDYTDINDPIDKVEIIIQLQRKEKINLFLEKMLDNRMFFKEEYITRKDLQDFYDNYITNYLVI